MSKVDRTLAAIERINELSELLGEVQFEICLEAKDEVIVEDIRASLALRSSEAGPIMIPMNLGQGVVSFGDGNKLTLLLPVRVNVN